MHSIYIDVKMEDDFYFTIKNPSEGLYKEKGSKFLAFAFPVSNENEIKKILDGLKKKYHDARHHCYAWRIGASKQHFRVNDDGEPHNSAGKPILSQIEHFNLTNILVVVVRYFGGTLLGLSGLIKAYKSASHEALRFSEIEEKYPYHVYRIKFGYAEMNHVMKIIKDLELGGYDQIFEVMCELKVKVRSSLVVNFTEEFSLYPGINIELLKID